MKYIAPEYRNEAVSSEDIMAWSPNNVAISEESFDFGDGNGAQNVNKATSAANILDLLFK